MKRFDLLLLVLRTYKIKVQQTLCEIVVSILDIFLQDLRAAKIVLSGRWYGELAKVC